MDPVVLDTNTKAIGVVDTYESFLWVERFANNGDFEIVVPSDSIFLNLFQMNFYLTLPESKKAMIVDTFQIETDIEIGNRFLISGESLESILKRRIVWVQTILSGNFQTAIQKLLNENAINPSITDRKIPNLVFKASTDPVITALTINAQFTGTNLFKAIKDLCDSKNIGFKIEFNDDFQLEFSLYAGKDRSYSQETNPWVVFSPENDNIISSSYFESIKNKATVSLIGGEGEGTARRTTTTTVYSGAASGLDRYEIFTDARDISSNNGTISATDYNAQLVQRGKDDLEYYGSEETFESEIEPDREFQYDRDYFMGDIVQFTNEYAMEGSVRVMEYIRSKDKSGPKTYPTFEFVE